MNYFSIALFGLLLLSCSHPNQLPEDVNMDFWPQREEESPIDTSTRETDPQDPDDDI